MGNKKLKCRLSETLFLSLKLMFSRAILSVIDLPSFGRIWNVRRSWWVYG